MGARGQPDAAERRRKARDRYQIAEIVRWDAEQQIGPESQRAVAVVEDGLEMEHDLDHRDRDRGGEDDLGEELQVAGEEVARNDAHARSLALEYFAGSGSLDRPLLV